MTHKLKPFLIITLLLPQFGISQVFENSRSIKFNGTSFNVPLLTNYQYFNYSKYRNQSMSDFTKNSSNPNNKIVELEILIPNDSNPLIQIYSFKEFSNFKLPIEAFRKYKDYIKKNVIPSKYDSLSKEFFKDTLVIKKLGNVKTNYSITETILENENRLVVGMLVKGQVNKEPHTLSIISNYLYINESIIIIRFTLTKQPNNLKSFLAFQESYITKFFKNNQ